MTRSYYYLVFLINILISISCVKNNSNGKKGENITPNQFKGSDIRRIRCAINAANGTTNRIVIPSVNSNGTNHWLIDSAIQVPGNMTIILNSCTIQLSDSCRDNMFRSENVGTGITDPRWIKNINIVGIGNVMLKGAVNPRATGDSGKKLGRSYGSDEGKAGRKQTGDWRNIMILMAYVDGFKLKNVDIENSHAWAMSFERTLNADISEIKLFNPEKIIVNDKEVTALNKDGIDLRNGCKNFRIDNITGMTSDDFIALSILSLTSSNRQSMENGNLNSTMVTTSAWRGPEDDIEQVYITNITCESYTRAVAIRSNDSAGIKNVYINGLIWRGHWNAILAGGKGYGKPALPGRINNIHAMNVMGNGQSLIHVEEAIADCSFMNCAYTGTGAQVITYNIDKSKPVNYISREITDKSMTKNVITENIIKIP
jgi:hypothetical protein